MSYHDHLPVYQLAYSFILNLHKCTNKYSKHLKYNLGTKCFDASLDIIKSIIEANQAESKQIFITHALANTELMFTYLRMSEDLNCITAGEFENLSIQLKNISDQLKAWQKWSVANLKKN